MRRILPLLLTAVLLLTGCGVNYEEEPGISWEEYQQSQSGEAEAEQPTEEQSYPSAFSMAYYKGHTLDPITCGEGIQQDVAALLYEPLVQLNENFEPVPLLCESWSWDESGLVLTLVIRQGVTFSDGSELTAADAADTLRRAAESQRYSYRLRQVTSITSSNSAGTVTITLSTPNRGFPSLLDIPVVKRSTSGQSVPLGTGPYVFVTGSDSDSLVANSGWWQQKSLPVDTITLVHAKDKDTAMYLFSSHRIELLRADPTSDLVSASGKAVNTPVPTTTFQFIGFNTASGVFSSAAARAAFSKGIQRDMVAEALLSGNALPAAFPISPLSALYPEDLAPVYSYEGTVSDLTAAGANTGQSQTLILLVNEDNSFRVSCAEFIAENMSLLDWQITVKALPWEEYLAALAAGEFDLYYGEVRLTADWDITDLVGTGGSLNYGGYTNTVTDALLQSFANASDRAYAARQLCAHLLGTAPIAPICFQQDILLTHDDVVSGMTPTATSVFFGLENWTIHLEP